MTYPGDESDGDLAQDETAHEEQLTLADEDEALPWLEADEYEEEGGFDYRLIFYAIGGLAVIAALLAAIWWFGQGRGEGERVADGSTIEAPDGPYKQRPDDPGGAEVAGTGDQAFQVAEGESTRGRVDGQDGGDSDARPSVDVAQSDADEGQGGADEGPAGAVYVQIGAYGSRSDADAAWSRQAQRYSALSGMSHRVVEADVNGATVFRLQAISGSRSAAEATCRSIRDAGGDCYIR
ncbi:SPOR domain-containing protein [Aurantiacibacter aquimixticola]|uniref:SPOR domain-containing protein n=1 Tax=Aurantiacibacter aquimixticola TaxID=1958945 RepID=A0A419RTB9_9SPHN|nr:SPOR domain-containing protein [Aurantiacibacter aquimixticola]RJY09042.1 SPOR domain-containing protein [Aurantiacibacter aquimixticola]